MMRYKKRFKRIKEDIEVHVSTISPLTDRGLVPMVNLSALLLRFQSICEGLTLEEAIKIQSSYMKTIR